MTLMTAEEWTDEFRRGFIGEPSAEDPREIREADLADLEQRDVAIDEDGTRDDPRVVDTQ